VNGADPDPTRPLRSGETITLGLIEVMFLLPPQAYRLLRTLHQ
jgi:hypothetical protein